MNTKDRLKDIINKFGLSYPQFSLALDLPERTIGNILTNSQKLSGDVIIAVVKKVVKQANGKLRIISDDNPKKVNEASLRMDWLLNAEGEPFEIIPNTLKKCSCPLDEKMNKWGRRLQLIQIINEMTDEEFAASIGISESRYMDIVLKNLKPTADEMLNIFRNYNVTFEWLFKNENLTYQNSKSNEFNLEISQNEKEVLKNILKKLIH